jgi:hypothetical protein
LAKGPPPATKRAETMDNAMWKTQLRVDPADGNAYPLASFLECYGEYEGHRRWAAAGQQPAYTGISLCMCILAALRSCPALHAALVV